MNELKKRVVMNLNELNQTWVNAFKEAKEKQKGVDLSDINSKFSQIFMSIDTAFMEFNERNNKNKGKKIFGR